MTTHATFTAFSKEGKIDLRQDFYTYSDGQITQLIEDLILFLPNYLECAFASLVNKDGRGSHWVLSRIIEFDENRSMEVILKKTVGLSMFFSLDLHHFTKWWLQYGSFVDWLPFSSENTGGVKDWAYYTPSKTREKQESVFVEIISEKSEENKYCMVGYKIVIKEDFDFIKDSVKKSLEKFKKTINYVETITEEKEGEISIFIPFYGTVANYIFNNQNTIRDIGLKN